jgi:hypothetical protein
MLSGSWACRTIQEVKRDMWSGLWFGRMPKQRPRTLIAGALTIINFVVLYIYNETRICIINASPGIPGFSGFNPGFETCNPRTQKLNLKQIFFHVAQILLIISSNTNFFNTGILRAHYRYIHIYSISILIVRDKKYVFNKWKIFLLKSFQVYLNWQNQFI